MVQEEIRKGPWTEQEDLQLDCFVGLFGDRRWDFIAKVSGLKRTGKSCRLRWVNYLHPGLKRGKMTPHEEQLVLELHAKWGNRWSRIAKKLPGRTDNEIKNYWRTHTRKKAQKRKRAMSPSSSSSNCCSLSPHDPITDSLPFEEAGELNFYDTGGQDTTSSKGNNDEHDQEGGEREPSMDEIWNDIALLGDGLTKPAYDACMEEEFNFSWPPMAPPIWDFCPDSLLRADEESEMLLPIGDHQFASFCENEEASLIG